jgi:cation transport ATPase
VLKDRAECISGHEQIMKETTVQIDGMISIAVLAGNRKLIDDNHIALDGLNERAQALEQKGNTVVYSSVDGSPGGLIAIADAIRLNAKQAIDCALSLDRVAVESRDRGPLDVRLDPDRGR